MVEAHDDGGEMSGLPRLRALIARHAEGQRALGDFLVEELTPSLGRAGRI